MGDSALFAPRFNTGGRAIDCAVGFGILKDCVVDSVALDVPNNDGEVFVPLTEPAGDAPTSEVGASKLNAEVAFTLSAAGVPTMGVAVTAFSDPPNNEEFFSGDCSDDSTLVA